MSYPFGKDAAGYLLGLFPNWSGTAQGRSLAFSGDQLRLTAPPMRIGGMELTLVAIWRRLRPIHV